ncbi:MAG: hypothetical protein HY319_19530 [Armatimonadetes bacterium]|nr:hypothetical protein [Armatimonadota bacterium]
MLRALTRHPLALALLALWLFGGCTGTAPEQPAAVTTPALADADFDHRQLPERVEKLRGVALVDVSEDLAALLPFEESDGGFFVLLSQKAPDGELMQGVLVRAGKELSPEELLGLPSSPVAVSGNVRSVTDNRLKEHFLEQYSIRLAERDGRVQWIDNELELHFQEQTEEDS